MVKRYPVEAIYGWLVGCNSSCVKESIVCFLITSSMMLGVCQGSCIRGKWLVIGMYN